MSDFLRQFRSRRLLCQTLADFSARQRQLVEGGEDDALVDLMQRKDRVLTRLSEESNAEEWRGVRDFLDPDTRAECGRLLEECEAILAAVQRDDLDAAERLTARRDETKRQLESLSQSQSAAEGYQASAPRQRLNLVT